MARTTKKNEEKKKEPVEENEMHDDEVHEEEMHDEGAHDDFQEATHERRPRMEGNFVFIGKKGVMAYVLAVTTQFSEGAKDVTLKARGKSISRAVDVEQIVRNKYPEIKIASIDTGTEEVVTEDGRPLKISTIAIKLKQ